MLYIYIYIYYLPLFGQANNRWVRERPISNTVVTCAAGVRLHLIILYAFCRVTDNMIDSEQDAGRKERKLSLIERFIDELFADRRSDYEVRPAPPVRGLDIDWTPYRVELADEELSCFRALSRISFYLPRKPFYELLEGYRWDVAGKPILTEDDLLLYSSHVASSVGVLCVYVMVYNSGSNHCALTGRDFVLQRARQMGQVRRRTARVFFIRALSRALSIAQIVQ